ncbi:predicted protein [Lichtheimia corymbifera JMRC:FSU:9682]|uniref:Uncharacterized protein n=1 Tax=Lichtheimia corymbifera JMRC:FSU:9682 TaxID=1263082 RepID=A0A068RN49_9FUNG|nr:predicted protein [Lichtheimia corymbifera JMRC:FSU:9682]
MNNIFGLKAICYEQANPNGHNGVECALSDTQDCCLSLLLYRFTLGAAARFDRKDVLSFGFSFQFDIITHAFDFQQPTTKVFTLYERDPSPGNATRASLSL